MNVIVTIEGQEAIPVRAIPLLTDWEVLSPDVCANAFAGAEHAWPHLEGLPTFRLNADGRHEAIAPRWWANWIVRALDACSARITAEQASHEVGYQQWRQEALVLLPAGVFVWREAFEAAYQREYGPDSMRVRFSGQAYQADTYDLNFNPEHGPRKDWRELVLEGFKPNEDAGNEKLNQMLEWLNAPRKVLTGQEAAEYEAAWLDSTMDAAGFFALEHVTPVEAALLLCRHNPHETTEKDAEAITCDPNSPSEITPDDFKRLRRTFVDLDHTKPGNRPLVDWMRAAAGAGRRVHPWAHEYAKHRDLYKPETEPAPTPAESPLNAASAPTLVELLPNNAPIRAKRPTWLDVAGPHITEVMRAGQYATAKHLFRALEERTGPDSPFDKGTDNNRGSLFVRDIGKPLALKTVQNQFDKLREMAKKPAT